MPRTGGQTGTAARSSVRSAIPDAWQHRVEASRSGLRHLTYAVHGNEKSELVCERHTDAVVFDMDGVLIDSRYVIEQAWRRVADRRGRPLSADDVADVVHGRSGTETVRLLFPDRTEEELHTIWTEAAQAEVEAAPYPTIPGVIDLILGLRQHAVTVGLTTSSWAEKVESVLTDLGILDTFACRITREDVVRNKPAPDPYLTVSQRLGVAPERTLVFEDSVSGVRSAVAAGAVCIGIGGDALLEVGAAAVVEDFRAMRLDREVGGVLCLRVAGSAYSPETRVSIATRESPATPWGHLSPTPHTARRPDRADTTAEERWR